MFGTKDQLEGDLAIVRVGASEDMTKKLVWLKYVGGDELRAAAVPLLCQGMVTFTRGAVPTVLKAIWVGEVVTEPLIEADTCVYVLLFPEIMGTVEEMFADDVNV